MPSFRDIRAEEIRYDCRYYTGYKPCGRAETCVECAQFAPRGTRVLIIKLGAMGDVVRTACLLPALRDAFPVCHITWITAPESREILECAPGIDRRLTLRLEDVLALELESFDLLMNFDKDAEALALAARVRAREKRGFAPHPEHGTLGVFNPASLYALRLGLSDELKFRLNQKTYPEIIFEMAELPYAGQPYRLEPLPAAREQARRRFAEWKRAAGDGPAPARVIALNTGCGDRFPTKQWTAEGFAALARLLLRDESLACLLIGGPKERAFNEAIRQAAPSPRLWDAGHANSLGDFLALLEACDCVVSADSLGMHFAIALARPVAALFGPTSATEVSVFGRGEKIVTDFPCAPCYRAQCPYSPSCMEALDATTVKAAVDRALAALS